MPGIDFVKINDHEAALKYGITHPPGLIYFRKRTALIFDGNRRPHIPQIP